jgi:hypothetical protein
MSRIEALLAELEAQRAAFADAVAAVDIELVTAPGVIDDWSVRDMVVHVAFWGEHATDALGLASAGRGDEFAYDTGQTDAMNARLLDEARRTTPAAAAEREERAFAGLMRAVAGLDPDLLDVRLGNGDTIEEVVRYDGPDHYREHADQLNAWFGEAPA